MLPGLVTLTAKQLSMSRMGGLVLVGWLGGLGFFRASMGFLIGPGPMTPGFVLPVEVEPAPPFTVETATLVQPEGAAALLVAGDEFDDALAVSGSAGLPIDDPEPDPAHLGVGADLPGPSLRVPSGPQPDGIAPAVGAIAGAHELLRRLWRLGAADEAAATVGIGGAAAARAGVAGDGCLLHSATMTPLSLQEAVVEARGEAGQGEKNRCRDGRVGERRSGTSADRHRPPLFG